MVDAISANEPHRAEGHPVPPHCLASWQLSLINLLKHAHQNNASDFVIIRDMYVGEAIFLG